MYAFSNCFCCLQVETFGSMEREEKVQFILEQMRLGLARKDYIRTQIISKKISIKFFSSTPESDIVQVRGMQGERLQCIIRRCGHQCYPMTEKQ